jgi:hypothetical protein
MGVLVAASLFFATAGPALAQITLNTTSAATVTAVASTSAALQTAIETYAANPTAANQAAVTNAQNAYNAAVSATVGPGGSPGLFLVNTPSTVASALTVPSGQATAIFAQPPGTLTFSGSSRVTINSGGEFFLGTGATNLPSMGPSSPTSFTFSGLTMVGNGGAIVNMGTATITNSSFTGNSTAPGSGGGGGAIQNDAGLLTITNSGFVGNTSAASGGAIRNGTNTTGGTLTITNSNFTGNSAPFGPGGAIQNPNASGTITITNSIFENNTARQNGAINSLGTLTITNSSFVGNSSTDLGQGGAIGYDPPPLKWSDLRYVFDIQEDCNGKEAIQA